MDYKEKHEQQQKRINETLDEMLEILKEIKENVNGK